MGSVLDANSKTEVLHVGTVDDTAIQSCNISPKNLHVSSSETSSEPKPVTAPSLQIRTGSDNILLSSICPIWEDKLSQTPVIHSPSKSFETTLTTSYPTTNKTKRRKVYSGTRYAGPEVHMEATPTESVEVHALNKEQARSAASNPKFVSKSRPIQASISHRPQTVHTGNGNTSPITVELSKEQVTQTTSSQLVNSRNDSTNNNQPFQQLLKLPKFDGSSAAKSFMVQFHNCASFNQWNEETQLAFLRNALCGSAAQIL